MRKVVSIALAASLAAATIAQGAEAPANQPAPVAQAAAAALPANQGPLPAAGPAGVRQAQAIGLDEIPWVFIIGGSLVLTAIVLGVMHQGSTVNTGAPSE
jgi:hypothetical protein